MIHYNNALNPNLYNIPICRPNAANLRTTTDPGRVTCRSCLKQLEAKK